MKQDDIMKLFDLLCKYYNKESYLEDKEMFKTYYDTLKDFNIDKNYLKENILKQCRYFPKVIDMLNIIEEIQNKQGKSLTNSKICECQYCNGTGYRLITEIKNDVPYKFALACDCKNGDNKLYDGKKIEDARYRSNYIVPRFSQMFAEEV